MVDFSDNTIKGAVRRLYESDPVPKIILDHFATRDKNSEETTVDALQAALKREGRNFEYSEIREALKKLAQATDSRFIRGRRGGKTRVQWNIPILEMGKVARANVETTGAIRSPADNGRGLEQRFKPFHHRFPMREDVIIELDVPFDMTLEEANRLAQSIQALAVKR